MKGARNMDYPLLLGGEEAGRLHVEQQGLYTCMEVSAEPREGLLRIWVQGGGREAYLGLLQPGESGLSLRRRLSRREMAAFPQVIEQASDRRLPPKEETNITQGPAEPPPAPVPPADAPKPESLPAVEAEAEPEPQPPPESKPEPEAKTKPLPEPECITEPPTLIWRERRDGSLVTEEDGHSLLALPASLRHTPPGADLRRIGGREYLVFRY